MRSLSFICVLLFIACNANVELTGHTDSTTGVRRIMDTAERLEYLIADTLLNQHHVRIERRQCSISVIRDGKERAIDWSDYDSDCEGEGDQGLMVVDRGRVTHANIVAVDSTEFYFGCFEPTCRGNGDLFHCVLMSDGSLSLSDEDVNDYWVFVIIDPVRRLLLTRNSMPDIEEGADFERWYTVFYTIPLGTWLISGKDQRRRFRIGDSDPLFNAFVEPYPSDSVALVLYRRFMR